MSFSPWQGLISAERIWDHSVAETIRSPMSIEHVVDIDLRWGDADSFAHVNNVVFFRYLEEARARVIPRERTRLHHTQWWACGGGTATEIPSPPPLPERARAGGN